MSTVSDPIRSTFTLFRSILALEVGCIIAAAGPIAWPAVRARLRGARPLTARGVRYTLTRLRRLGLVEYRPGPNGLYLYTALPRLRQLLEVMEVTLETFQTPTESPPPSDSTWQADGPDALGL